MQITDEEANYIVLDEDVPIEYEETLSHTQKRLDYEKQIVSTSTGKRNKNIVGCWIGWAISETEKFLKSCEFTSVKIAR